MKLFKGYFNYGIRLKYPPVNRLALGSCPSFLAPHATHAPDAYINKQPGRGKEAFAAQQLGSNAAQLQRTPGKGPNGPFEGKKTFGAFEAFASVENREGASPLPMRYRLLSSKKAFLGKGDLKHTNNKVIITFYLYNANQMFISSNFNDRVKALLLPNKSLKIISQRSSPAQQVPLGPQADIYKQPADLSNPQEPKGKIILYNRMFNIYEFLASDEHYLAYYNTMGSIIKKINIVLANLNYLLAIYIYILKTHTLGLRSSAATQLSCNVPPRKDNYGVMQSMHSPSLFLSGVRRSEGGAFFEAKKKNELIFFFKKKSTQEKNNGPSGTGQILSKINSFFFIYNNLFKTNILKDNLKNNLFNIFFNLRLRKYRLLLKRKFLITNDILKIASASSTLKQGSLQASAAQLSSRAKEQLLSHREGAGTELSTLQESSIFNFEYYLYKMSLSYLEKVFLY